MVGDVGDERLCKSEESEFTRWDDCLGQGSTVDRTTWTHRSQDFNDV